MEAFAVMQKHKTKETRIRDMFDRTARVFEEA
jgi:hypothetical protein